MPLTELNHYLLVAKDLEKTKNFYCAVLGFQVADRPNFGFPGYWLKLGDAICVHLASQEPDAIRDTFLLKHHPPGTTGSGSVDHIAFLATQPFTIRDRLRQAKIEMHYRSIPESQLFQLFFKDPDDITIELNFFGEIIEEKDWTAADAASKVTR